MPRKILVRTSELPYHITNRSNNREHFYLEKDALWTICLECLYETKIQFKTEVHAFVLMSNHYHLLISTPQANIGEAMKYFHREVARKANRSVGRINHFFGGRYQWSLINSPEYFWNAVKYVFRNPIRAGICQRAEDYEFSSLNRNPKKWTWQMTDFFLDRYKAVELCINWLNEPFHGEKEALIKRALRRREFKPPRNQKLHAEVFGAQLYKKGTVT